MRGLIKSLVIGVLAMGCLGASNVINAAEPIKIGGLFSLSGPWAEIGNEMKNAFEFVFNRVNKGGGINDRKIEFIAVDTGSDPDKGLLAAKRLVEEEKVIVILGPGRANVGEAIKPYIHSSQVPAFMLCLGDDILGKAPNKWIFNASYRSIHAMERILAYMKDHMMLDAGFMYSEDKFGIEGLNLAKKLMPKYGINIVGIETFEADAGEVKQQLTTLRNKQVKAIVCWSEGAGGAAIPRDMMEMNFFVPFFQSHAMVNYRFIKLAGFDSDGTFMPGSKVYVPDELPEGDPQRGLMMEFGPEYFETMEREPDEFVAHAVDASSIVVEALKKSPDNRSAVRDAIEGTKGFVGLCGTYNMSPTDHSGLSADDMVLVRVQAERFRLLRSMLEGYYH